MDGAKLKIVELFFDKQNFSFTFVVNILAIVIAIAIFYLVKWMISIVKEKMSVDKDVVPVKLKYKLGGAEIEYDIVRNYQNIEIAHKIYIELITRKAAIEIEEEKDVIVEVYNSWYALFQITREQLKSINGKLLRNNNTSKDLVRLLTDILNKALRPHLTEYQARFRKWYQEQLNDEKNKNKSPQEIQKRFNDYDNLINSMKEVNQILIEYSEQLKKIIEGK